MRKGIDDANATHHVTCIHVFAQHNGAPRGLRGDQDDGIEKCNAAGLVQIKRCMEP